MKSEIKRNVKNRLKRIEGQVRGMERMVDAETYCIDVITQSSAIRNALSAVEDLMLMNHLGEHVVHQMKGSEEAKAVAEITKIFKKIKRK